MGMVNGIRALNALMSGTMTGAQLTTYLSTGSNSGSFQQLLTLRGQVKVLTESSVAMTAVAASSTAMTAVAASSTAMTAVLASSTAMTAVLASSTAMTAVAASSTAMTAVLASSTAMTAVAASSTAITAVAASSTAMTALNANDQAVRIWMLAGTNQVYSTFANVAAVAASSTAMTAVWASNTAADAVMTSSAAKLAVYGNDTALVALQATPAQVTRQISIGGRVSTGSTSAGSFTYTPNGTKVILLRMWETGGQDDPSLCFARGYTGTANSSTAGIILPITGENLGKSSVAYGHNTTYGNTGTYPSASNDNANVVSAANGLARCTWSLVGGTTQNVIYITV